MIKWEGSQHSEKFWYKRASPDLNCQNKIISFKRSNVADKFVDYFDNFNYSWCVDKKILRIK